MIVQSKGNNGGYKVEIGRDGMNKIKEGPQWSEEKESVIGMQAELG